MKLNHISEFKPDLSIYRYVKFEHFLNFVKTGKYGIGKVAHWEDPYENYLAKCPLLDRYENTICRCMGNFYGQCWTRSTEESDAMWRIYSRVDMIDRKTRMISGMAVRIKTTAERLQKITETIAEFSISEGYIGSVEYKTQCEIDKDRRELILDSTCNYWEKEGQAFFVKRKAFEHENEFRIIAHGWCESDIVYADAIPDLFIDEVTFDPRLTESEYNFYKDQVVKAGFLKEKINKSQLYYFEPSVIRVMI